MHKYKIYGILCFVLVLVILSIPYLMFIHLPDNHAMTMRACVFGLTPDALHGISYYGEDGFIEYPECIWVENTYYDNFVERLDELRPWLSDNCGFKELVFFDEISNYLDEPYDPNGLYIVYLMGPPAYLSQDELDTCIHEIKEKRNNDAAIESIVTDIDRESFCELHEGKWSSEFNNCVGGSMKVYCDVVEAAGFKSPDIFSVITEDGMCMSHGSLCSSMGGNSTCMSYDQKGHGRDVCILVCGFEE